MGYLSENCSFALLTDELQDALTGFDCQREPAIQEFFRDEATLNAKELMSKSYCFYKQDTMEAVAAFCVISTDIAIDLIPKSTRNKLNIFHLSFALIAERFPEEVGCHAERQQL